MHEFHWQLLDRALANPAQAAFLDADALRAYRGLGGVRIEDDVLVTETGCENFSADLPRTVDEIETFMREKK